MSMILVVVFLILAVVCFLIAMESDSGFFLILSVTFAILSLASAAGAFDSSTPTPNSGTCVVDTSSGVNTCDDNPNNDQAKQEQKQAETVVKKEEPQKQEQKKEEPKEFDWQAWADDMVNNSKLISCNPDGIQVYVSGTQSTDSPDSGPVALSIYPRLHKDGTPFTCSESKEPTKELKR